MEELFNLGINENDIKNMLELNSDLKDITNNEIKEKVMLLRSINCSDNDIKNIISSNSLFLTRTNGEIVKLIECLTKYGFTTLNILFDSNPYILNLEPFEIKDYIESRLDNKESLEDIVDDLETNLYLFNEM